MGGSRRLRAVVIALAALGASAAAEDPAPSPFGDEPEFVGEEKKKYDADLKRHLERLRKEKNQEVVEQYVEQLGASPTRAGRDALIRFARGNKNHAHVRKAFHALAKGGNAKAIEFLCGKDGVGSQDFMVQRSAVEALGEAKSVLAVNPLLDLLEDPATKIEVQGAIAITLAKTAPTNERVVAELFRLADENRDTIRANAMEAIGYFASKRAFDRLVDALENDENTRVRGAAATGLGHTKWKEAVEPLRRAASGDKSKTVTQAAMRALQELGSTAK